MYDDIRDLQCVYLNLLNPEMTRKGKKGVGGGGRGVQIDPPCGFSKNEGETLFFCDL